MTYQLMENPAKHSCWTNEDWDGTMQDDCPGCKQAKAHPCRYCGYGHVFTTHNDEPHHDGGDTQVPIPPDEAWYASPHLEETRERRDDHARNH
jgi:rRNA maturation protein Nop10